MLGGGITILIKEAEQLIARNSPRYTGWLVGSLFLALVLDNMVFGPLIGGFVGNYVLPALMWGSVIALVSWFPGTRPAGKIRLQRMVSYLALMCVLIAILFEMIQGALATFGRSPFDRSYIGITINSISLLIFVIAIEWSRSWLLNRHFRKRPYLGITLMTLLFTPFFISFNKITTLNEAMAITKFIGMDLFPELGQNLLATYLVFLGGPLPGILYRGCLLVLERLTPVLPNANWAMQTLLGTLAPLAGLLLVKSVYQEETRTAKTNRQEENPLGWMLTSLGIVLIVWFSVGVFSYSPRVILSGSMQPGINVGDIVIIKKIDGTQAQEGDIIMFPLNNMKVTHRVIEIQEKEGKKYFVTKGDANIEPERDPVLEKNVQGKVVLVIPKAGKLTILIRSIV